MPKKKTSLAIDDQVWTKWLTFVIQKTGSSRKVSEETVNALEEYMKNHGDKR
jgi:hypothetical protein